MFQKKNQHEQLPGSDATTILAAGTRAIGDFECANHLRIDGQVKGHIRCDSKLVIGQTGRVEGSITCANADIAGQLDGDITVYESLVLRQGAVVNGNISANMLQMEAGVIFNGQCRMQAAGSADAIAKPSLNGKKTATREVAAADA